MICDFMSVSEFQLSTLGNEHSTLAWDYNCIEPGFPIVDFFAQIPPELSNACVAELIDDRGNS